MNRDALKLLGKLVLLSVVWPAAVPVLLAIALELYQERRKP